MIGRKSVLLFTTNLFSGLLGYLGILAVARLLPNADEILGFVGFGLGFVGSFFVLTGLGVPAAHIKRVSEGEPLGECIGALTILRVIQVVLAIGVTLLAVFLWTTVLGRGFETPLHLQLILVMVVYYAALSVAGIGLSTFNARLETAKSQASNVSSTVIRVAGMVVVAFLGLGALALAWIYVLGAVVLAVVALFLMRNYRLRRPRRALVRSYLRFAFPLALPAALAALSLNLDKALIQLFWGVAEVGYYFTVQRIILLLTLFTSAVSLLLFPAISQYHARNDLDLLRVKSRESERYLSMILAPIAAFLFLYPAGVIHVLLSDVFLPATDILRFFSLATFLLALTVPRGAILAGMNRADLAGIASLGGALVTLALYPLLIPTSIFGLPLGGLGPEGAALGVLVGNGVLLIVSLYFANRLVGDRIQARVALHVGTALVVGLLASLILSPTTGVDWRWYHLVAYSAGFLAAYVGLLAAFREFRRADLRLFLDLLNPRKMAQYVRGELLEEERR